VFEFNGVLAEFVEATIAGIPMHTLAVESVDLEAAREARRLLGLDEMHNTSYPRAIHRVLGWYPAGD
jgi:hypothetical protein